MLRKKYERFFYEVGDGLYPWELLVNNFSKNDDMLSPPAFKYNLLHPAPTTYYNNQSGDIEPGLMIEVLGFTKIDYVNKMHFGAAIATDFSQDKIRYGGVVHLPLKHAFDEMGLNAVSGIVPCEVCSFVLLTDGDDNWSVGIKLNIANLLFKQENNIPEALKALF